MSSIFVKILPTLEKQKLATDIICGKNVLWAGYVVGMLRGGQHRDQSVMCLTKYFPSNRPG